MIANMMRRSAMRRLTSNMLGMGGVAVLLALPLPGNALTLSNEPLFLTGAVQPLVMLNISKDHQLSYKAYNDYSDLDGDGDPETTYKDTINYYGYFDSQKCYTYNTTSNRFVPAAAATGTNLHYCSGQWSGNFLNWGTMTRMDAVRKLLYGGKRSTDTATLTVLERQFLPTDAHAFAKYYNGSDISSLTPFSTTVTSPPSATSSTSRTIGSGSFTFTTTLSVSVGDQVRVYDTSNPTTKWMIGGVTATGTGTITIDVPAGSYAGSGSVSSWTLENISQTGISLCNLTKGSTSGTNQYSHTNTNPPMIRVAKGNFALWSANERWQCYWSGEKSNQQSGFTGGFRSNGNKAYLSGINASGENPTQATHGLGSGSGTGEYYARVEVCNSSLIGQERCQLYGSSYKPIGLLQTYGDNNQLYFGLVTGSFAKNISGGVLRKNAGTFTTEVNSADGTFTGTSGIVTNLNNLRIYGYDYNDGTYIGSDSCTYQQTGQVLSGGSATGGQSANQGNCSTWGNPMSEVYLESLRYLAGKTANANFTYMVSGSKDAALGLTVATWSDPLSNTNFCSPLNVLNFNASVSSYDDDQMGGVTDLGATSTAQALTNTVGTLEGISGNSWFVGSNGTTSNDLCSSKAVTNFGSIYGLCPEAPSQKGTYLMSGVAYYAHTHRIRSDLTVPSGTQYANSLKVSTYGIALATNVPKIEVTVNGKKVTILPAYRLDVSSNGSGPFGGGTIVDFKVITQTATYGKFYVNWEDSEMGGDYDQDMWGVIEYSVSGSNITITTDAVSASTANGQGFGYIISGTNKDGPHFHSGIYNFDYTDPTGVTGCSNCVVGDAPTAVTYTATGSSAGLLKDPLWYAAKYGGFSDTNGNDQPDQTSEWDSQNNTTNQPGSDGIPDNFFYVTNPLTLEKSLNATFLKILKDSSASAVATNSSSLNTGSRIYQGRFSNTSWSGQVLSYRLDDTTGQIIGAASYPPNWDPAETPYPEWDAGQKINGQTASSRLILTTGSSGTGTDFQYGNMSSTQQGLLDVDMYATNDKCGPERVAYLRGDRSNEGVGTFTCTTNTGAGTIQKFRTRNVSVLGDVINSNPVYVGPPSAGYSDVDHPGYSTFQSDFSTRKPLIYVGANDGMLHGIDVTVNVSTNTPTSSAGTEVIAYLPSMVYVNLNKLTDDDYKANGNHRYFVDSSPMVADVCTASCTSSSAKWATLLVSGLGGGGKGFFALNITNPDVLAKDTADTPVFLASNAANIVRWEFKADSTGDTDLGYTFNNSPTNSGNGQAKQIAKFENGRWGVVVGNGYNSTDGKAVLYVLFVNGPTGSGNTWQSGGVDFVKIVADAPTAKDNGLSTPVPFDSDGNGLVDTVYAGDIKGNMWRFDLSNASAASWTSASPLFAAKDGLNNPQPITNAPEVTLNSIAGNMVLFGTGKFLEPGDTTSTAVQTFYGIQDTGSTVSGRGALIPQVINATTRVVSQGCGGPAQPACSTTPQGWYADLPIVGEKLTGSPKLLASNVYFNTFIPSTSPCKFGGDGYLMGVDYMTGAMAPAGTFDTNNDGTIDSNDTAVGGILVGAALGGTTLIRGSAGSTVGVGVSSTTDGKTPTDLIDFGVGSRGRINWREIVQ